MKPPTASLLLAVLFLLAGCVVDGDGESHLERGIHNRRANRSATHGHGSEETTSLRSKRLDTPFHGDLHYYWSRNCPVRSALSLSDGERLDCCCSITDYGAIGDNSTLNTLAIQSTIDGCHERCWVPTITPPTGDNEDNTSHRHAAAAAAAAAVVVVVYVPPGMFRTGSLALLSHTRLHLARGAALYGSDHPGDYPLVPMLPNGYETHKSSMFRALISGYSVQRVSITGENAGYPPGSLAGFSPPGSLPNHHGEENDDDDASLSVIDGVGWKWWCKSRSMPILPEYCQQVNPDNETMPDSWTRPKLVEFYNSTDIRLDRFTARNSPFWFLHPFLSKNIAMTNLTLLAPREVGNTDGLDPDSCENVLMDSCYIDVGDDGVSIKSTNHSGTMAPTRNVTMRNLWIKSRNWCIGSATFGGVYDILFEDSTIGDLETVTSPWAIKFKSHRYFPGPMENITIRRIAMGKLGPTPWMYPKAAGSAFLIGLSYGEPPVPDDQRAGKPVFRNVTLQDISVVSAGVAGQILGFPEDCLQGLSLTNITVRGGSAHWRCENIDLESLDVSNVHPPVTCTGGCSNVGNPNSEWIRDEWEGKESL